MTTQFLVGESPEKIGRFRPIFDQAVNEAKQIAQKAKVPFYDIVEVRFSDEENKGGDAGTWTSDNGATTATIALSWNADPEALTHEVAHSFFHGSPLHDRHGEDPKYGDKFCNAFRYALHPNKGKSWMATDGGQYDAHALVKKCEERTRCKQGNLLAAFTEYFVSLCERKRVKMCGKILDSEAI